MKENGVNASVITIGDELLIGQTIDTNSAFIAKALNKIGVWVARRIAVGDVREEILDALERESSSSQIIIITGGLGPTADDITKPALCDYFGATLVVNSEALENVKAIFRKLNRPMIERNTKQAEVPDNCTVLQNRRGTAPGMWFERDGVVYISLPGVPYEMEGLMESDVIPKLQARFTLPHILHKTVVTFGKGESEIAEVIMGFEAALPENIKLAYLPAYGMVKLRLTGRSSSKEALEQELEKQVSTLKRLVEEWLVTDEDKVMAEIVGDELKKVKKFVATAESCTGGYIAHLLTSRSGSSSTYKGGVVSYANEAKERALGVQHSTLVRHGAVSEETIIEMVNGVLHGLNADYAVATSGVMGPDGGTPEKPVGTVWIAVADRNRVKTAKHFVRFDRRKNIEVTAQYALNQLRLFIKEQEG
jgi:nicotinamide-nucleotide amidase